MSEILGFSLLFSMVLIWLSAFCMGYVKIESENLYLLICLLLKISVFGLPILFAFFADYRFEIPLPELTRGLRGFKKILICVSSVGIIVLFQIFYSAIFPSSVTDMGVSHATSLLGYILMFAVYVVLPAVFEELLFRGIVMRALTVHRKLLALLISSLSFALMHFSIERFPIAFLCGMVLGIAYLATGSMGCVILIHLFCNAVWYAAEITRILFTAYDLIFIRLIFAVCVLMIAAGLPMMKMTLGTIFEDDDEYVVPSSCFWSIPYVMFIVLAVLMQIF